MGQAAADVLTVYIIFLCDLRDHYSLMGYCIEMRPPPSESQNCRKCLRPCFPGHRRRDPFGAYYCASCGNNVHYVIRKALENNGLLQYFVVAIPGFLRYVPPAIIGLGDLYIGARFNYVPPPASRNARKRPSLAALAAQAHHVHIFSQMGRGREIHTRNGRF